MTAAVDLVSKIAGILAAVLGTAGYVFVLGAAILWLRLHQADLPAEVPVSLAAREELIAMGAQAVAVWVLLLAALGAIATWIVTGDPGRRHFGYREAGLAVTVTVSSLLVLEGGPGWMLALPILAGLIVFAGALYFWPSADAVAAMVLPIGIGFGLAVTLSHLSNSNGMATSIGATLMFGTLLLFAPPLQRWRSHQESNRSALAQIEVEHPDVEAAETHPLEPLVTALKQGPTADRPVAIVWIGRVAIGLAALLALGAVSVASQLDREGDFHSALISLTNGDCLHGTYITRGASQIVIAQPALKDAAGPTRVTAIPDKEILEVQVYRTKGEGRNLTRDAQCAHSKDALVHPAETAKGNKETQ